MRPEKIDFMINTVRQAYRQESEEVIAKVTDRLVLKALAPDLPTYVTPDEWGVAVLLLGERGDKTRFAEMVISDREEIENLSGKIFYDLDSIRGFHYNFKTDKVTCVD